MFSHESVLTLENGYHHFIDTCICGRTGSCRIVIDGAIVRLIRFGTPLLSEKKTILTDAVITVNRGELRYLNDSYVLDEFKGALTVIFNHDTYRSFLADYSVGKVFPEKGRWILDSAKELGASLIAGSTAGEFFVSGGVTAYAVSEDGTTAFYSVGGVLRLPAGIHHIHYAPLFSAELLPPPPAGLVWEDTGLGTVVSRETRREVFVSEHGSDDGDGSAEHPLRSVDKAAMLLGDNDGTVHLSGTLPFVVSPSHKGVITYQGEGKSTRLVFEKPYYYYLSGDSVFDNMYLVMYSESTALVSGGHSLRYRLIWTTVNMYSVLGQPEDPPCNAVSFSSPLFLENECSKTIEAAGKTFFLYCFSGDVTVQNGKQTQTLPDGSALLFRAASPLSLTLKKQSRVFGCVIETSQQLSFHAKPYRAAVALLGEPLERLWRNPTLLSADNFYREFSEAVHTAMGIDDNRMKIHHQLKLFIESHFSEISSVEEVAARFHMNRSYLEREFKKVYGIGIKQELTHRKMEAARRLLAKGFSVSQTAKLVGYESAASLSRAFRTFTGLPPSVYYRNN